ncbi:MAG TPA: DNA-binding response regulator [Acidobacteria bacterium]|nr:DNA-binding response regulator [Acidobacteriota bacterium]
MTLPKIQVLIVDDHAIVRTGLRLLIGGQTDMSVVGEAGSTQEGIELAEGLGPDIALVDLSLPGEGGIEVIRHLRRTRPRVRTVALTMHDEVAYLHSALSAGCSGYVVKRAADSELLAAIRAVHSGGSFISALFTESNAPEAVIAPPLAGDAAEANLLLSRLSARERQVLVLLAHGHTHAQMATELGISVKTVETHRARLSDKLRLKSRSDLVRLALEAGLLGSVRPAAPAD